MEEINTKFPVVDEDELDERKDEKTNDDQKKNLDGDKDSDDKKKTNVIDKIKQIPQRTKNRLATVRKQIKDLKRELKPVKEIDKDNFQERGKQCKDEIETQNKGRRRKERNKYCKNHEISQEIGQTHRFDGDMDHYARNNERLTKNTQRRGNSRICSTSQDSIDAPLELESRGSWMQNRQRGNHYDPDTSEESLSNTIHLQKKYTERADQETDRTNKAEKKDKTEDRSDSEIKRRHNGSKSCKESEDVNEVDSAMKDAYERKGKRKDDKERRDNSHERRIKGYDILLVFQKIKSFISRKILDQAYIEPFFPTTIEEREQILPKVKKTWFILAWTLLIVNMVVSSYLIILYGLKLGQTKANIWLTTTILGK